MEGWRDGAEWVGYIGDTFFASVWFGLPRDGSDWFGNVQELWRRMVGFMEPSGKVGRI